MKDQIKLLCLLLVIVLVSSTCLPYLGSIFGDTEDDDYVDSTYENAIDYGTTSPSAIDIVLEVESTSPPAIDIVPEDESTNPPVIDIVPEDESTNPPAIDIVPEDESTSPPAIADTPPPPPPMPMGSISGFVWLDDTDDKQPIADFSVYLYKPEDLTQAIDETTTDITGMYVFENLEPGLYVVGLGEADGYTLPVEITEENKFALIIVDEENCEESCEESCEETNVPTVNDFGDYDPTVAYTEIIFLFQSQVIGDINAVLQPVLPGPQFPPPPPPPMPVGSISGFVLFEYADGNLPVADYTVYLYNPEDLTEILAETTTDTTGAYTFDNLAPGEYVLAVVSQVISDFRYQLPIEVTEENMFAPDPDNETMAFTETIVVAGGEHVADINAVLQRFMNFRNTSVTIDGEVFVVDRFVRTWQELSLAISASNVSVIALRNNITLTTQTLSIGGTRNVTIISDMNEPGAPFTLIQDNIQRHFSVTGSLRLVNVHLTSSLLTTNTNNRGGILVMGNLTLSNGTTISNCRQTNRGAGILVAGGARLTMDGGEIFDNTVSMNIGTNQHGGAGVFLETSAIFTMNGGSIHSNTIESTFNAWHGGAGVGIHNGSQFIMNGGSIHSNTSSHQGGGVFVGPQATFTMFGGSITDNVANSQTRGGGGIAVLGGRFITANPTDAEGNVIVTPKIISNNHTRGMGGAILVYRNDTLGGNVTGSFGSVTLVDGVIMESNTATLDGGAIALRVRATLSMDGGTILRNITAGDGGGISMDNDPLTAIDLRGGTVSDNIANNGGALFVPHGNLGRVDIAPAVVFTRNHARNGSRINDNLANQHRTRINPGTVTLNWNPVFNHAFTNFDINVTDEAITVFYQVTLETRGETGNVTATEVISGRVINSGEYVVAGTQVRFTATPGPGNQLEKWEVGTSANEGGPFDLIAGEPSPYFDKAINTHTHVIGYFNEAPRITDVTISKTIAGDLANMTQTFEFTVYVTDSSHAEFQYESSTIPGGVLVFDEEGKATFTLGHGQEITIKDVPVDAMIRIVETTHHHYIASFKDSAEDHYEREPDTGFRLVGEAPRTFDFLNTIDLPPPVGVDMGTHGPAAIMLFAIPLILLGLFTVELRRRRAI